MKFYVDRASDSLSQKKQPCEGAEYVGQTRGGWDLWQVEIPDLNSLMEFMDKHGDIILSPHTIGAEGPALTIYDSEM